MRRIYIGRAILAAGMLQPTQLQQANAAPAEPEAAEATEGGGTIPKITPAAIKCFPEGAKAPEAAGKPVLQASIFGLATGVKKKEMPNGDTFYPIVGNFEAINAKTGEVYNSGQLYLPSGIHEMIASSFLVDDDKSDTVVQFAIDLFARVANNPRGYEWLAKSKVKASANDPLAALRNIVKGLPALPAPDPETEGDGATPGDGAKQVGSNKKK